MLLTGVQLGVILMMIVHTINITLDCDFYTPSSELFKELNWQIFPKRVTYQKAILMYRIINNICPDCLKSMSHILINSCRDTRSSNFFSLFLCRFKAHRQLWSFSAQEV